LRTVVAAAASVAWVCVHRAVVEAEQAKVAKNHVRGYYHHL
jgi:hypothetical protein